MLPSLPSAGSATRFSRNSSSPSSFPSSHSPFSWPCPPGGLSVRWPFTSFRTAYWEGIYQRKSAIASYVRKRRGTAVAYYYLIDSTTNDCVATALLAHTRVFTTIIKQSHYFLPFFFWFTQIVSKVDIKNDAAGSLTFTKQSFVKILIFLYQSSYFYFSENNNFFWGEKYQYINKKNKIQ